LILYGLGNDVHFGGLAALALTVEGVKGLLLTCVIRTIFAVIFSQYD